MQSVRITLFSVVILLIGSSACSFVDESTPASVDSFEASVATAITGVVDDAAVSDLDSTPVVNAQVHLYKVKAGKRHLLQTSITDDNGQFSFADINSAVLTRGAQKDFYYEVETQFDRKTLLAAIAPQSSVYLDVNRRSTLFAHMVRRNLAKLSEKESALPTLLTFERFRKAVDQDVTLSHLDMVMLDSHDDAEPSIKSIGDGWLHTGMLSAQLATQFRFQSRWYGLKNGKGSEDAWAVYMRDIALASCGDMKGLVPLPIKFARGLGRAARKGKRYSIKQVVDVFNEENGNMIDHPVEEVLEDYREILYSIAEVIQRNGNSAITLEQGDILFFTSLRKIDVESLDENTKLDPDQAAVLWFWLAANGQQFNMCKVQTAVLGKSLHSLTKDKNFKGPAVVESQIYHVYSDDCHGIGKSAFRGEVYVNIPGDTEKTRMHSLRVRSSDPKALKTDTMDIAYLFLKDGDQNEQYSEELSDACVQADVPVTYKVEARLFKVDKKKRDLTAKTETINTNHWSMPPFTVQYNQEALSPSFSFPTVVSNKRPYIRMDDPKALLEQLEDVPEDAHVKYGFRFFHENTSAPGQPLQNCSTYPQTMFTDSDQLLLPEACDRFTCANAMSMQPVKVQCRLEVTAFLLDKEQRILSKSRTKHGYLCVDDNGDGSC